MDEMKRNKGTCDGTKFRLKGQLHPITGKEVAMSFRQLSKLFSVPLSSKREAEPYWLTYLDSLSVIRTRQTVDLSPLRRRLESIQRIRDEGQSTPELEKEYARCLAVPHWDIDNADLPVIHPTIAKSVNLTDFDTKDELNIRVLNSLRPISSIVPVADATNPTLRSEIDSFIARYKAKGHSEWHNVKKVMEIYFRHAGNVSVKDLTVTSFRDAIETIKAYPTWGATTQYNARKYLVIFLKYLHASYEIKIGYVRLHKVKTGNAKKIQWTPEQMRLALNEFTGIARTVLLCEMNFGFYRQDIIEMNPDKITSTHIKSARAKLKANNVQVVGSWKIWYETRLSLKYGLTKGKIDGPFNAARHKYNLPIQKAIRSGVAQWIEDNVSEKAARLFRGEAGHGVHHRSYIRPYTPEQIKMLDDALDKVAAMLGIE